jgi:hypothetical protein
MTYRQNSRTRTAHQEHKQHNDSTSVGTATLTTACCWLRMLHHTPCCCAYARLRIAACSNMCVQSCAAKSVSLLLPHTEQGVRRMHLTLLCCCNASLSTQADTAHPRMPLDHPMGLGLGFTTWHCIVQAAKPYTAACELQQHNARALDLGLHIQLRDNYFNAHVTQSHATNC